MLNRLKEIAADCERLAAQVCDADNEDVIQRIQDAARIVGRSASGSWLGHQALVYYKNFEEPPPHDRYRTGLGLRAASENWCQVSSDNVEFTVLAMAKQADIEGLERRSDEVCKQLVKYQSEVVAILGALLDQSKSTSVEELRDEARKLLVPVTASHVIEELRPKGHVITRDYEALSQGQRTPPHVYIAARVAAARANFDQSGAIARIANSGVTYLHHSVIEARKSGAFAGKIFIGHGRSPQWRELSAFIQDRLKLNWDEFNREPVAGLSVPERLQNMLEQATFALLVMTAEDEHADSTLHARENVIHETGLFQGCLGFKRAIVLLEEGCQEFSNIQGLVQIRYPSSCIKACFEEIRGVLEREGLLANI